MRQNIFWTADEYKLIAQKLDVRKYPFALVDGQVPGITLLDLNRAIRAALPEDRHRKMANQAHLTSFGRRLRDTLEGKKIWTGQQFADSGWIDRDKSTPPPAPAPKPEPVVSKEAPQEAPQEALIQPAQEEPRDFRSGPRVMWSQDEWEALVHKLYELDPALETQWERLSLIRLNEAAALMARPRRFFSVNAPSKFLAGARSRISTAKATVRRAPPPVDVLADGTLATMAATLPPPKPVPAKPLDVYAKVEWTRDEWLLIAEELHKVHGPMNYPKRGNLVGLDTDDVHWAQERVLPLERQRRALKVASFSTLRAPLLRAFADLRDKLDGKPVTAPAAQAEPIPAPLSAPPPPAPTPIQNLYAAPPAPEPAQAAPEPAAAMDPYRAAFAPLMSLLVGELATHLKPMLTAMVDDAIGKLAATQAQVVQAEAAQVIEQVAAQVQAQHAAPVLASVLNKRYGDDKPQVEKPKKLVVGVLVNRPSQYKDELERTFPMVEIKIAHCDEKNSMERFVRVDKMIGMERFVNHACTIKLKKLVGDRYTPCNGAMSELKRIIAIWLRGQGIEVELAA